MIPIEEDESQKKLDGGQEPASDLNLDLETDPMDGKEVK